MKKRVITISREFGSNLVICQEKNEKDFGEIS